MSDKSNEQISNLMDGELEVNASQFLLKRMAADKSLSQTWENYHLIKSCLQKEEKEPLVIDIASRVSAELGCQKTEVVIEKPAMNKWLKPIMGFSIAASVAFTSVLMINTQQTDDFNSQNESTIVVNSEFNRSINPQITASMANGDISLVTPPASLSRFPSVPARQSLGYSQGFSNPMNVPYILVINQSRLANVKQLSPMKIKDLSD